MKKNRATEGAERSSVVPSAIVVRLYEKITGKEVE